jgi:hypothetical protein
LIEAFQFWREQRRIHTWMDKLSRSYDEEVAKIRASGVDHDELNRIAHERHFEQRVAEDELNRLTSRYYVRLANRLLIPIPEFKEEGGAWMESSVRGGYYMTPSALNELRTAIRAERKARREEWTVWLSLAVGFIGSVTGLVAVWKK